MVESWVVLEVRWLSRGRLCGCRVSGPQPSGRFLSSSSAESLYLGTTDTSVFLLISTFTFHILQRDLTSL